MLEGWLDYHRADPAAQCAGLTAEQLQTASVEPSGLTLLGLVRHMTEVERPGSASASPASSCPTSDYTTTTTPTSTTRPTRRGGRLRRLPRRGRSRPGGHRRAVPGRDLPDRRDATRISLRWVYVHMIEEYARHNGHADLIRERIDGVTGCG